MENITKISKDVIMMTLGDILDEKKAEELSETGFTFENLQYIIIARENKRLEYCQRLMKNKATRMTEKYNGSDQRLRIIFINDVYEVDKLAHFAGIKENFSKGCDLVVGVLAGDFLAPSFLTSLDNGKGVNFYFRIALSTEYNLFC